MQYFNNLDELIEFYKKENMGLIRNLKFPVPREEEEPTDEPEEDMGKKSKTQRCGLLLTLTISETGHRLPVV